MILPVRRPDYLGDTKWKLRHGKRNIAARIDDKRWLRGFQQRKVDVCPGDALRCMVETEARYGHDNELIDERFTVVEVLDVLLLAGPDASELPFEDTGRRSLPSFQSRPNAGLLSPGANL